MKKNTIIKLIALTHIITATGIYLFWIGFYTRIIFPFEIMSEKITNFAGYYAWETSFTIPDSILALTMIAGGIKLLLDTGSRAGRLLLVAASGGCAFLGILDFTYDFSNGMYSLGHLFSYILLEVGVFLPLLSIFTISYFMMTKDD